MLKRFLLLVMALMLVAVMPLAAQDATSNTLTFNGVSVTYPSDYVRTIVATFAGDAMDVEQPGGPEAKHIRFEMHTEEYPPFDEYDAAEALIRVYSTGDLQGYTYHTDTLASLQALLNDRPELVSGFNTAQEGYAPLPYLPTVNAAQVFVSQPQYVETDNFTGIAYLTGYRQDASEFIDGQVIYTVQMLSRDGGRYVAADFIVSTAAVPVEPANIMFEDAASYEQYLTDLVAQLDAAGDFNPTLDAALAIVNSISFGSAGAAGMDEEVEAEATPSDPTLGGLAGTWTLLTLGDPANPVTAQAENLRPLTIAFSPEGVGGFAGCNTYRGNFQYDSGTLTFGPLASTRMACADEAANVFETNFLAALGTVSNYTLSDDGQTLTINYEGGALVFQKTEVETE